MVLVLIKAYTIKHENQNTPPFLVQKSSLVGILVVLSCVKQFQRG